MSAYLITRPRRALHVGTFTHAEQFGWALTPICGQAYNSDRWYPPLSKEEAARRLCSRCVGLVAQMSALIENAAS